MRIREFLREFLTSKPIGRQILWAKTTSHNGYIREKALIELTQSPIPEDWPYALERLNDWVPQVNQQAELLVEKLIDAGHAVALANWTDQLSSLAQKSRAVSNNLLAKIILTLSADGCLAGMWPNLSRVFRERAVRTLLDHERLAELFTDRELKDLDPFSIQLILREQKQVPEEQILALISHPDPGTRSAALETATAIESDHTEVLRLALFDRSSRVRTTAQYLIGKRGIDARLIYLSQLDSDNTRLTITEGFCEVATVRDLSRLRQLYVRSASRQRKSIARALCRLEDTTLLIPMLSDTSGKVRQIALELALRQPGGLGLEERQALFQSENLGVKRVGAKLLMSQSRWTSLIQMLMFLEDEDDSICAVALDYLRAWLRWASRSPSIPDPATYMKAVAIASQMGDRVPEPLRLELKQILTWTASRIPPN